MAAKSAVDILIQDHQDAKGLFEQILAVEGEERQELFDELCTALKAHVTVEKEIFYPGIKPKLSGVVEDSLWEKQTIEETEGTAMLEELVEMGADGDGFEEKFTEFRDIVLEHAIEDEERTLFPLVREKVDMRALEDLGRRMAERKQELISELERAPARSP